MTDEKKRAEVPVTILTGFLGAGKTSLMNHILTGNHGKRIAVLVNDFGAVNIDAELIDNRDGEVVSLANGCICCSLSEGLLMAVVRLIASEDPPEHILIETSGVSDPFEVAQTLSDPDLRPFAPLEGIVTVVDAEHGPGLKEEMMELARRQIFAADIAILNKVDLVDAAGYENAKEWIRSLSPNIRLIDAEYGKIPLELMFDIGGAVELAKHKEKSTAPSPNHAKSPPFETYTFETHEPLSAHNLHGLLGSLPSTIFRAKGLVNLAEKPDHPCLLQHTGRRSTLTVGEPWEDRTPKTQLVFIGSHGGVDADWIAEQIMNPIEVRL